MFAAALEELAGQLAALQPPPQQQAPVARQHGAASGIGSSSSSKGSGPAGTPDLLQRVLARAPSEPLAAYVAGRLPVPAKLQRSLPEQLDQNMRLLGVLAAEMRRFVGQMETLADAAGAAVGAPAPASAPGSGNSAGAGSVPPDENSRGEQLSSGSGSGGCTGATCDAALLMAGVLEGITRETALIVSWYSLAHFVSPAWQSRYAMPALLCSPRPAGLQLPALHSTLFGIHA